MKCLLMSVAIALAGFCNFANAALINVPFSITNSGGAGWSGSNGMVPLTVLPPSYVASGSWISHSTSVANGSPEASNLTQYSFFYDFVTTPLDNVGNPILAGTVAGTLQFDVAADNSASLFVNGTPIITPVPLTNQFGVLTTINWAGNLNAGANQLEFRMTNEQFTNTGLLVVNGSGTYQSGVNPIPEPATLALWCGLGGVGYVLRRKNRKTV